MITLFIIKTFNNIICSVLNVIQTLKPQSPRSSWMASFNHWWRRQVQFRSIFDERHELGQEIRTNARNTAGLCGLSLSCCFDLIVYITKISKHWEFAHIAWLCPWRSYIYFVWVRGVCWKRNEIEIVEAKYVENLSYAFDLVPCHHSK